MSIERLGLILAAAGAAVWLGVVATSLVALLPWGLVGFLLIGLAIYMLLRAVSDHRSSAEDQYYENNFDK
ncbi:MAG: hypothetical protein VYD64_11800 [Pseudomonadota bacterium]|nr:hypothetical protein [Pseudomonadota bacterium]